MPRGGKKKISSENQSLLCKIVKDAPCLTNTELEDEFERRAGVRAHIQTIQKSLSEAGMTRWRDAGRPRQFIPPQTNSDYGYNHAHRRDLLPEQGFASCLTDHEWALVSDLFDQSGGRGKPPRVSRRQLLNGCCYVVRTGCAWRMLPKNFGPWENVYHTFRRWSDQGKFEEMHDRLRTQWREREGKTEAASAAIIDAQSNRSSPQGGDHGFDAGKKVKGRKRHVVVDTLGLVLAISVTAANISDGHAAHPVMASALEKYPSIQVVFADSGYAGRCAQTIQQTHDIRVDIVRHPANRVTGRWIEAGQGDLFMEARPSKGFVVQPKRWIVERTHAWIEKSRRLVMHHDRLPRVSEAWVWLAQGRMLLRRLST